MAPTVRCSQGCLGGEACKALSSAPLRSQEAKLACCWYHNGQGTCGPRHIPSLEALWDSCVVGKSIRLFREELASYTHTTEYAQCRPRRGGEYARCYPRNRAAVRSTTGNSFVTMDVSLLSTAHKVDFQGVGGSIQLTETPPQTALTVIHRQSARNMNRVLDHRVDKMYVAQCRARVLYTRAAHSSVL